MKFLERLALIIFSIIILVLAVVCCLVVFNVIEIADVTGFVAQYLENEIVSRTVVVVSVICILLALKSLFFPARNKKKEELKSGVLLENQDGRLLISKDTIENLVNSVVHSFPDAIDAQTKVFLDVENNITVFISLLVKEEAIIKQLSAGIQNKIKETIKRNTDLEVKQVNINVKNIESEKNKKDVSKKENSIAKINMENVQFTEEKKENITKEEPVVEQVQQALVTEDVQQSIVQATTEAVNNENIESNNV